MKIFLSWSKDESRELAQAFEEWIHVVLQQTRTFISTEDIQFGDRWVNTINDELNGNDFGIIFLTSENLETPWLNFESGALSVALNTRVIPIDFSTDNSISEAIGDSPLQQFNRLVTPDYSSFLQMVTQLNKKQEFPMSPKNLEKTFDRWWPDLEKSIADIQKKYQNTSNQTDTKLSDTDRLLIMLTNKINGLSMRSNSNPFDYATLQYSRKGVRNDIEMLENIEDHISSDYPEDAISLQRVKRRLRRLLSVLNRSTHNIDTDLEFKNKNFIYKKQNAEND